MFARCLQVLQGLQVFANFARVFQLFSMAAGSLVSEGKWQEFKP